MTASRFFHTFSRRGPLCIARQAGLQRRARLIKRLWVGPQFRCASSGGGQSEVVPGEVVIVEISVRQEPSRLRKNQ